MADLTDALLRARSPLSDRAAELTAAAVPEPGGVWIRERRFRTQVNVRVGPRDKDEPEPAVLDLGSALSLPTRPNTVSRAGRWAAYWLGPDEWLLTSDVGAAQEARTAVWQGAAGVPRSAVDVSAHRTVVELGGSRAREVLRTVCPLDSHLRVFGPGQCAQTLLADVPVLIAPRTAEVLEMYIRSSFADYLADWLLDAMAAHRH